MDAAELTKMAKEYWPLVASIGTGIVGGGGLVAWFSKLMFTRMIDQYDNQHRSHSEQIQDQSDRLGKLADDQAERLSKISDRFSKELTTITRDVAVLQVIVEDAKQIRGDVAILSGKIEAIKEKLAETKQDLNVAHERVRSVSREVDLMKSDIKTLSGMRPLTNTF